MTPSQLVRGTLAIALFAALPVAEGLTLTRSLAQSTVRPTVLTDEQFDLGKVVPISVRNDSSASFWLALGGGCGLPFTIADRSGAVIASTRPTPCPMMATRLVEVVPGASLDVGTWDQRSYDSCVEFACTGKVVSSGLYEARVSAQSGPGDGYSTEGSAWFWVGPSSGHLVTVRGASIPSSATATTRVQVQLSLDLPAGTTYDRTEVSTVITPIMCIRAPCINPATITLVPLARDGGSGGPTHVTVDIGAHSAGHYEVRVLPRRGTATTGSLDITGVSSGYSDVPDTHWAWAYVSDLTARGIVSGHEDGAFRPQWGITRAEVAKVALKSAGIAIVTGLPNPYSDLAATHTLRDALLSAIAKQYLADSGSLARPDARATRFETLKALMDAFGRAPTGSTSSAPAFPDAASGAEQQYSTKAAQDGIITGNDGRFLPTDPITRAEVCKIIWGLLNHT